jgi:hypothetical protein
LLFLLKNGKSVCTGKRGQTPTTIRKMSAMGLAAHVGAKLAFGLSEFENVEQDFSLKFAK